MCEFCLQHGEGQRWYFAAKNYSEDLLSDLNRQKFIQSFLTDSRTLQRLQKSLDDYTRAPALVQWFFRWQIRNYLRKNHYGQILPIEDVRRIFDLAVSIVRMPCICRKVGTGQEKRYCYGISMGPDGGRMAAFLNEIGSFLLGPDTKGLETLTKEEALAAFHEHERQGLCHSVWTFVTPFIAGICNCDRPDCLAMKYTVSHGFPIMNKADYIASIEADRCQGCRKCMTVCQFGAIFYSAGNKKAGIDQTKCYGCGICRSQCEFQAIRLDEQNLVPEVTPAIALDIQPAGM